MASDQFLLVSQLLAAAALFALAGALLWLKFSSPIHRAFALFLFLRGMASVANQVRNVAGARLLSTWNGLAGYFFIAAPFALVHFVLCYGFPPSRVRVAKVLTGLAALALEALYAVDHCLAVCGPAPDLLRLNPLAFLYYAIHPTLAAAALFLAWRGQRERAASKRQSLRLLALAFLLNALLDATIAAWFQATGQLGNIGYAPSPWLAPILLTPLLVFPLAVPALALLCRLPTAHGKPAALQTLALALLAVASGIFVSWASDIGLSIYPGLFLIGLWRILLPALAAYAIVRHRLFGVDVKIRWTLRRGTVVGVFLAVFLIVGQVGQNLLNARFGLLSGGVAAGLLVFALSPLEKLGHRVADALGPRPQAALTHHDRLQLYEEQATLVWSDGVMGAKENLLLERLRSRLGLGHEEAARINHAAAQRGLRKAV
ncbi:MAG TPA: hypothetical protein VM241_05690 [Candidatus Thermoplasmatota archaeon]|nr:hypothetical protein [Candidatus Thermoplasmatota archaeon]